VTERKRALVVGGSSGLGLAVAKSLSARGEAVVVTSRDIVRAKAAAREIGGDAMGLAVWTIRRSTPSTSSLTEDSGSGSVEVG